MKILVVDDYPEVLRIMTRSLAEGIPDADIRGAGTVREALALTGPFDLLVLDRRLPNGDGRTIAEYFARVPTVYVSGQEDTAADLRKPFTGRELVAAVREKLTAAGLA